jgi:anti-sigma regulatory factor (Ser/Thr protein kinase)
MRETRSDHPQMLVCGGAVLGSVTIRGRPSEVAAARRFVEKTLGDHPQADTAVLLTSEAVTNAVIHTTSETVTVAVVEIPRGLRFEVADDGADTLPAIHDPGGLREGQRGMYLIRELSARCGFVADGGGLICWFEL